MSSHRSYNKSRSSRSHGSCLPQCNIPTPTLTPLNCTELRNCLGSIVTDTSSVIRINQESFQGRPVFVIREPGSYRVVRSLTGRIIIAASNVTLDIAGHTITSHDTRHSIIAIHPGVTNIRVINGIVTGRAWHGIHVHGNENTSTNIGANTHTHDNIGTNITLERLKVGPLVPATNTVNDTTSDDIPIQYRHLSAILLGPSEVDEQDAFSFESDQLVTTGVNQIRQRSFHTPEDQERRRNEREIWEMNNWHLLDMEISNIGGDNDAIGVEIHRTGNVTFDHVTLTGIRARDRAFGILAVDAVNLDLDHVNIYGVDADSSTTTRSLAAGFRARRCRNINCEHINIGGIGSSSIDSFVAGFNTQSSADLKLLIAQTVDINSPAEGQGTATSVVGGVILQGTEDIYIDKLQAAHSHGSARRVAGAIIEGSRNYSISKSAFTDNFRRDTGTAVAGAEEGGIIIANSQNGRITTSEFADNARFTSPIPPFTSAGVVLHNDQSLDFEVNTFEANHVGILALDQGTVTPATRTDGVLVNRSQFINNGQAFRDNTFNIYVTKNIIKIAPGGTIGIVRADTPVVTWPPTAVSSGEYTNLIIPGTTTTA